MDKLYLERDEMTTNYFLLSELNNFQWRFTFNALTMTWLWYYDKLKTKKKHGVISQSTEPHFF